MKCERLITKLKINLFDIIYMSETIDDHSILEILSNEMKTLLEATNLAFSVYHFEQMDDRIRYVQLGDEEIPFPLHTEQGFFDIFQQYESVNVDVAPVAEDGAAFLLRISKQPFYHGLLYVSFAEQHGYSAEDLEQFRLFLKQFILEKHRLSRKKVIETMYEELFRLSERLQLIHETEGVLQLVVETSTKMYPNDDVYLLMSQEYNSDRSQLPIKLIEYTRDMEQSPGTKSFINNELIMEDKKEAEQTSVYAPLSGAQGVYGVLQINFPYNSTLLDNEVDFIKNIADMTGRAIERTNLYQTSNQLVTDLQVINTASHELNLNLDYEEITETIKKHIMNSCQPEEMGVVFFNNQIDDIEELDVFNQSTAYFHTKEAEQLIKHLHIQLKNHPKPTLSGHFQSKVIDIPFESLMVIPIIASSNLVGMIIIGHRTPYYFSFDKFKFIQSLVQHASLAYMNSYLKNQLKETIITDYLTKVHTRVHLDEVMESYLHKGKRGAFILLDVDDFKDVNDTYGHHIGDKVLIQVARVLKDTAKNNDLAARWGGEEFALYLPEQTKAQAIAIAEQIRENILLSTEPKVTASLGVISWPEGTDEHEVTNIFIQADEALYEAKETGKNRVIAY